MQKRNVSPFTIIVTGFLTILIGLVIVGMVIFWQSVQQAQKAIQPVSDMTNNLGTEVAKILNPTPTILPDPVTIIHSVRTLARLETIQYSVEKVITAESGQGPFGFLFGDRLLLVAHGTVVAGVDLEKITPKDLWVEDEVLYVRLPEAEVFIASLNNEQSYIYDRDLGYLTKGNVNLETEARRAAEIEILEAALEDGILAQAQQNSENYLLRLFIQLGFPEVIFVNEITTPQP
jgi:hypothetical protein